MFTCVFLIMILNLLGVHLTQLLFVYETLVLFHIAQAICNRLTYFVGLKLDKPYLLLFLITLLQRNIMYSQHNK